MAFIRIKTIKGVKYYYLVKSIREDGKVKQKIVQYFGTTLPNGYVVPTKASVVRKEAIKKAGTTKVSSKVSTTPSQTNLPLTKGRGGNRHPIAVKQFILDRLAQMREDHISGLHQAYNAALDQLSKDRYQSKGPRKFYYRHPVYSSFRQTVWNLKKAGLIEFSGREEPSDDPHWAGMKDKPMRKYYRLAKGH